MGVVNAEKLNLYCGECEEEIISDISSKLLEHLRNNGVSIHNYKYDAFNFQYECDDCGALLTDKSFKDLDDFHNCKDENIKIVNAEEGMIFCKKCYEENYKEEE